MLLTIYLKISQQSLRNLKTAAENITCRLIYFKLSLNDNRSATRHQSSASSSCFRTIADQIQQENNGKLLCGGRLRAPGKQLISHITHCWYSFSFHFSFNNWIWVRFSFIFSSKFKSDCRPFSLWKKHSVFLHASSSPFCCLFQQESFGVYKEWQPICDRMK